MKERILIIEDDALVAKSLSNLLVSSGYFIEGIASSCAKAEELFILTQPDLVICNLYLKYKCGGSNFIDRLRKFRDIPVLHLSAYSHDSRLDEIMQTDFDIYVSTPYTKEQFIFAVKKLLRKHPKVDGNVVHS